MCTLMLALFFLTGGRAQQDADLLREIKGSLERCFVHYGVDLRSQNKISDTFDSLMNALVERQSAIVTPLAENTLDNKIYAIARYKAQHPDLFEEIASKYVYGVSNPSFRAPAAPQLESNHLTEPYRLVWEYFILMPPSGKMSAQYDRRISKALSIINNLASLVTLDAVYHVTLSENVPANSSVIDKRRLLLITMAQMPSDQSLRVMLKQVVDDSTRVQNGGSVKWDPQNYVRGLLTGEEHLAQQDRWRTVLSGFRAETLDPRSRQVYRNLDLK